MSIGRRSLVELEQVFQVLRGERVHLDHQTEQRIKTTPLPTKNPLILSEPCTAVVRMRACACSLSSVMYWTQPTPPLPNKKPLKYRNPVLPRVHTSSLSSTMFWRQGSLPPCRDARVYGHTSTAMHDNECTPPPPPPN